jgi:5-methyltetrahydrofolate--homocysteine methyltransferase
VRNSLTGLLETHGVLLADGATGTNYFAIGLESGEPPELWNVDRPENVASLHQRFVDAGADIILTNTFGCNRNRLALHRAEHRVAELAKAAATIASGIADAAGRPVVVAGSVGPTGELFAPLGALTHDDAVAAFRQQIEALVAGGADVAWIETMSAPEEIRAAALAAIEVGVPYTATCSFDTAGRTMMGLLPGELGRLFADLPEQPLAYGANCGVGAPDILVSLLGMADADASATIICKGNCGVPRFEGTEIVYSGTPDLMGRYAALAVDAGARIVGGCCGTTPEHLASMRAAIDGHERAVPPDLDRIVVEVGPLANAAPGEIAARTGRRRR